MRDGLPDISDAPGSAAVDDALDRFEALWRAGQTPPIRQFLPEPSQGDPVNWGHPAVAELVRIDLWYRWRRFRKLAAGASRSVDADHLPSLPTVADYVRCHPEWGAIDDVPAEVVAEEYRVRLCCGDLPDRAEYVARYPHCRAAMEEAIEQLDEQRHDDTHSRSDTGILVSELTGLFSDGPVPDEQAVPRTIGKYHVLRVLDQGGQAQVYLAVHPGLAKEVVIKLGFFPVDGQSEHARRLVAEARLLAELEHPNLARVYDLDFHEGRPYLVMEYVRGFNLRQYAQWNQPTARQAAELIARTARAVHAVHGRGVLHRDIKPQNILVDEAGQPRLIDFGLARICQGWADDSPPTGEISGTAQFMSPEQARGDAGRLGQRADVFALGAVLYYLLTGKVPFAGNSPRECLAKAVECDFDRDALRRPGIPPRLAATCLRAMQSDPDRRYADADQFAAALDRACRPSRRLFVGAVAAGLAAAILAALTLGRPGSRGEDLPPYLDRPQRHDFPLTFELLGQKRDASGRMVLEEGQRVAFSIQSQWDCCVGVWHVDRQGNVTQLFPNQYDPNHFLHAGESRTIPSEPRYAVQATVSDGPEFLHVVASTARWEAEAGRQQGPFVVFATPEDRERWRSHVRSLVLKEDNSPAVSEAVIPFVVRPRPAGKEPSP
jgi:tRNA A-37 threonylcarbamoyl transferase component Bud32